jgi:hypothetical protein
MNNAPAKDLSASPKYEPPTIKLMSDEEVLRAFQMTAAQIGAAATWWSATCSAC